MKSTQRVVIGADGRDHGLDGLFAHAVAAEDVGHFLGFLVGEMFGFIHLAAAFGFVMVAVRSRGEVSSEAHGDGAGGDFRQAGDDHDVSCGESPGEAGGKGEGNGETVGHADNDVANGFRRLEVLFDVRGGGHRSTSSHGRGTEKTIKTSPPRRKDAEDN